MESDLNKDSGIANVSGTPTCQRVLRPKPHRKVVPIDQTVHERLQEPIDSYGEDALRCVETSYGRRGCEKRKLARADKRFPSPTAVTLEHGEQVDLSNVVHRRKFPRNETSSEPGPDRFSSYDKTQAIQRTLIIGKDELFARSTYQAKNYAQSYIDAAKEQIRNGATILELKIAVRGIVLRDYQDEHDASSIEFVVDLLTRITTMPLFSGVRFLGTSPSKHVLGAALGFGKGKKWLCGVFSIEDEQVHNKVFWFYEARPALVLSVQWSTVYDFPTWGRLLQKPRFKYKKIMDRGVHVPEDIVWEFEAPSLENFLDYTYDGGRIVDILAHFQQEFPDSKILVRFAQERHIFTKDVTTALQAVLLHHASRAGCRIMAVVSAKTHVRYEDVEMDLCQTVERIFYNTDPLAKEKLLKQHDNRLHLDQWRPFLSQIISKMDPQTFIRLSTTCEWMNNYCRGMKGLRVRVEGEASINRWRWNDDDDEENEETWKAHLRNFEVSLSNWDDQPKKLHKILKEYPFEVFLTNLDADGTKVNILHRIFKHLRIRKVKTISGLQPSGSLDQYPAFIEEFGIEEVHFNSGFSPDDVEQLTDLKVKIRGITSDDPQSFLNKDVQCIRAMDVQPTKEDFLNHIQVMMEMKSGKKWKFTTPAALTVALRSWRSSQSLRKPMVRSFFPPKYPRWTRVKFS